MCAVYSSCSNSEDSDVARKPFIIKDLPEYCSQGYSTVRIGLCQVFTEEWAIEDNIRRALEAIDQAASQKAEIALIPECVIHAYPFDETHGESEAFRKRIYEIAEDPGGEHLQLIKNKAKEKQIYVCVGFVEKGENGQIHNTAALISPDGEYIYRYRKVHCRHFESINHWGYFTPGSEFYVESLPFKNGSFKIGTIICFDREIPETLRCMRSLGAELILCPLATNTSSMTEFKNRTDNEIITRVAATSNEQFIVVVNHAGRFNGGSFIVGPMGELFCQMSEEPGVLTYDIPLGVISEKLHSEPLGWMGWGYRRPEVYSKYI
jgi:predicted amidohydrolase